MHESQRKANALTSRCARHVVRCPGGIGVVLGRPRGEALAKAGARAGVPRDGKRSIGRQLRSEGMRSSAPSLAARFLPGDFAVECFQIKICIFMWCDAMT